MNKFNFNIDNIDLGNDKDSLSKSSFSSKSLKDSYIDYLQKNFVDLGLPSKIKWAKYNIGVDPKYLNIANEWIGNYYAWGEVKEKQYFTLENYAYYKEHKGYTKYNHIDELNMLLHEDDIAYKLNKYKTFYEQCIPTRKNFVELRNYTTQRFVNDYNNVKGLNGLLFISKQNNNEVFLPCGGFSNHVGSHMIGRIGYYWTKNMDLDNLTKAVGYNVYSPEEIDSFEKDTTYLIVQNNSGREYGHTIRAICKNIAQVDS